MTQIALYYLDVPVLPLWGREAPPGWVWCRWADDREFLHWHAQLCTKPYCEDRPRRHLR